MNRRAHFEIGHIRIVWSVEKVLKFGKSSKIEKNHEKMKTKSQKSWKTMKNGEKMKNHFFKICLWLICGYLGADFNHFGTFLITFEALPVDLDSRSTTDKFWKSEIFIFFHRKFLLWVVSQSWRAGEDFPVYESFKVELLQKICKSIHYVLSRMSPLHSDDSMSAFKNIGFTKRFQVSALWNRLPGLESQNPPTSQSEGSETDLQAHLGSTSKLILEWSQKKFDNFPGYSVQLKRWFHDSLGW